MGGNAATPTPRPFPERGGVSLKGGLLPKTRWGGIAREPRRLFWNRLGRFYACQYLSGNPPLIFIPPFFGCGRYHNMLQGMGCVMAAPRPRAARVGRMARHRRAAHAETARLPHRRGADAVALRHFFGAHQEGTITKDTHVPVSLFPTTWNVQRAQHLGQIGLFLDEATAVDCPATRANLPLERLYGGDGQERLRLSAMTAESGPRPRRCFPTRAAAAWRWGVARSSFLRAGQVLSCSTERTERDGRGRRTALLIVAHLDRSIRR